MNVQLLPLFQGESQVLVEMGDPRHGIAALERVAAAGGSGLHGGLALGRWHWAERSDAAGAPELTAAAAAAAAARGARADGGGGRPRVGAVPAAVRQRPGHARSAVPEG